jgi:predicted ATPase
VADPTAPTPHIQIVITGGPGGGKTTFLHWLRETAPDPERFLPVPEAATRLIQSGMRPGSSVFQEEIIALQVATEWVSQAEAAPGQILICDRGTLDGLAYWKLLGLPVHEFFEMSGMSLQDHLDRYTGVIHLRAAAKGAVNHYQRIDFGRPEPPEEALRIDQTLLDIWSAHPCFHLVENGTGGWPEKLLQTWDCLTAILEQVSH